MKHPDWRGHNVFCGCNDKWQGLNQECGEGGDLVVEAKCPDCRLWPWYYPDKSKEPHAVIPPLRLSFTIDHPGETAAGISSFTDTVTVEVESGDPGGEEGEFAEFMTRALREWYDGAKVELNGGKV